MEDTSAQYSGSIFQAKNNLQTIRREDRLTFVDTGIDYSRLDAMKIAQEQAVQREAAAYRTKQSKAPPSNLLQTVSFERRSWNIGRSPPPSNRGGCPPPMANSPMSV